MSGVLVLLSLALVHAEPNLQLKDVQVKASPLQCIACAAQEVTCISTAVNKCKEQNACDTVMNATQCVTCIGAAGCGSDPACADCSPMSQLESVITFKKLIAANEPKEVFLESDPTLRAGCTETQSLMKTCGTKCYSSPNQATCAANCLKGVGVQSSCANCLGRKIQCTVKNCLNKCAADANSPACSSCVSRSCGNCNSEKSAPDNSFVAALVASSQEQPAEPKEAVLESDPTLRAGCTETQSLMKTCGTKCYSSPNQATCAANCLKGVGVQSSCANCLGRKIQCTVKNCLNKCAADANSPACSSCVSRSCGNCNSEKSAPDNSFVAALVELSQEQPTVFP